MGKMALAVRTYRNRPVFLGTRHTLTSLPDATDRQAPHPETLSTRKRVGIWLCTLALAVTATAAVMADTPERAKLDGPVQDSTVRDLMKDEEQFYSLADYKGKKTVVLSFVSYNCSVSWRYEKRLGKLLADYGEKDVVFLAVRSNARDTIEGM